MFTSTVIHNLASPTPWPNYQATVVHMLCGTAEPKGLCIGFVDRYVGLEREVFMLQLCGVHLEIAFIAFPIKAYESGAFLLDDFSSNGTSVIRRTAETVVTLAPPAGVRTSAAIGGGSGVGPPNNGLSASELNSHRVSAVIDHFCLHVQGNRNDAGEFINLCLSLARGIDFAIANNEVPSRAQELPAVIKQVCQTKNEGFQQAAIMVVMVSVKSACQSGWFSNRDSEELNNLATEVATTFGSLLDLRTVPHCSSSIISVIMSRFFPRMKMGHIFALGEVKAGFDAYLADFKISKNLTSSPGEKMRLVVFQTDNIETSSCLVSPPKVNFLVNGKGVERRTTDFMDTGPQNPTVIMHFLKYGSNLLQAVGEFNGHYLIAVTFMSEMPNPDSSVLQDYVQHATATVDSDSEVTEGPSRISLNCPISRQRIRFPVKGCSCNHMQCFDFDNYVDINSRRPSWRCPSCNQHVCFIDLRIDQKMVKVLEEVGPDVSDIIISSDGSWKAVTESDDITEKPREDIMSTGANESAQSDVLVDLTQINDAMDITSCGTEDTKHSMNADDTPSPNVALQTKASLPNALQMQQQHQLGNPSTSDYGRFPAIPRNVVRIANAVQALPVQSHNPVLQTFRNNVDAFISSNFSAAPRAASVPPNISTFIPIPAASQANPAPPNIATALPSQSPIPVIIQSNKSSVNVFIPNSFSSVSQSSPAGPNTSTPLLTCPRQVPLPALHQQHVQRNQFPLSRSHLQNAGFQNRSQSPNAYRISNAVLGSTQHLVNLRTPQPMSQLSSMLTPRSFMPSRSHVNVQAANVAANISLHAQLMTAANRTAQMAIDPSRASPSFVRNNEVSNRTAQIAIDPSRASPSFVRNNEVSNRTAQIAIDPSRASPSFVRNNEVSVMSPTGDQRVNIGSSSQPVTGTNSSNPSDMDWRPSARMRGALTGQAYIDALNQFIIQPGQQGQGARSIPNMTSLPADAQVSSSGNLPSASRPQGSIPFPNPHQG